MNDLERLKKAEEAEPMAVVVLPVSKDCYHCWMFGIEEINGEIVREYCYGAHCRNFENIPDEPLAIPPWCPARQAIAIVEPSGHVVYLREEEE